MAFIFGILANPGRGIDPDRTQVARLRRIDWLPRLALPALGIWIAAAGLPKLPGEWFAEKARVALRDGHTAAALDLARRGIEYEQEQSRTSISISARPGRGSAATARTRPSRARSGWPPRRRTATRCGSRPWT